MPHVHHSKTAGARRGMAYVGVSERSVADHSERRQRRARRTKKNLIKEAKLLAQSSDWRTSGRLMADLHNRWKAAGSAGREYDDKLWQSFSAPLAQFHERRKQHFDALARLSRAKRESKQQLIAEAEKLSDISDFAAANGQFKHLMARWKTVGHAGTLEDGLWERFNLARQAMYDATEKDRLALQSEYFQRVAARIQHHREVLGKLRSQRRELTIRRHGVVPGWVGAEMTEEFDRRIADTEDYIAAREEWLAQDLEKLDQAGARSHDHRRSHDHAPART